MPLLLPSLPVRFPTAFLPSPCSSTATFAVFSAVSCFRSISFSSTSRDAVTSRKTGGRESAVCCRFGGLSIPRSRRRRKNQEVVEAYLRRRTYNAFLSLPSSSSSSSSSSMAAACNSPPPDYRANVGICLVNDKNEVILFLLMMMNFSCLCSGGKKLVPDRVVSRDFCCNLVPVFASVVYRLGNLCVHTPKYFQVRVLVFVIQIKSCIKMGLACMFRSSSLNAFPFRGVLGLDVLWKLWTMVFSPST